MTFTWVSWVVAALIVLKWAAQAWLDRLNERHVLAHADAVPDAFKEVIDEPTYKKSVAYTTAKSRFEKVESAWHSAVLLLILFSGILPWLFHFFRNAWGSSAWSMAAFLFATGLLLSVPGLPFDYYSQFKLEERFGFNTTTLKVWWLDRVKGLLLAVVLGYPLLVLILKIVDWTGALWWLWAWGAMMFFQLLMVVLAPVLIMPLVQ